jgi:mRNA-degrading endonuclease RelE of RelBE toxin-antitoxin system
LKNFKKRENDVPHPVRFLKSAEEEFFQLPLHIQEDVAEKIKVLSEFPYSGKAMEKTYEGYRSTLAGRQQYRIIYRVLEDQIIEIAYVRHCRRQMKLRVIHN